MIKRKNGGKTTAIIIAALVVVGICVGGYFYSQSKKTVTNKATLGKPSNTSVATVDTNKTSTDITKATATEAKGTGKGDEYENVGYNPTTGTSPILNDGKGQAVAQIKSSYTSVPDLGASANPISEATLNQMKAGFNAPDNLGYVNPIPSWYKPNEIIPGENIIESANSYAVPANQVALMISGHSQIKQKEVFLAFDDGPSVNNTPKILQILKKNNVHATFFLIGDHLKNNAAIQNIVRQEIMDGNAVGDHTFTHQLPLLYPTINGVSTVNVPEFMSQINQCKDLEHYVLGPHFDTRILRLPGGYMSRVYYHDPHLEEFNKALDQEGWTAMDWTADSGVAATQAQISPEKMLQCSTEGWQEMPQDVILLHDAGAKVDTVNGLQGVITFFKDHGYKFMVIKNAPTQSFKDISYTDFSTDSNQGQVATTKPGY
ncbi:polysaccharide deacetylase family protein [Clostridium massiliamazoniense]|uniref:polysaccharide deacetylase family protein n=1 Tax=Clostridium massiliamazoniense TaxID=1347366 RepID=UPI0006D80CF3|nr:polysaccharide deacetylase family protein [Clostridium massiliamazoniense]